MGALAQVGFGVRAWVRGVMSGLPLRKAFKAHLPDRGIPDKNHAARELLWACTGADQMPRHVCHALPTVRCLTA